MKDALKLIAALDDIHPLIGKWALSKLNDGKTAESIRNDLAKLVSVAERERV